MKRTGILIVLALLAMSVNAEKYEQEKEAIKEVIQTAYIDGIHNLGDVKDIEAGFHPGFNLLGVDEKNMLTKYPIYSWLESVKKRKEKNPEGKPEEEKITCKYNFIDVTGQAAMAKIELYRKDKKLFTDYLQLYKFEEGWRIVSKTYHRH
ncbi:MAG: nuclear transport factor 2 family protein [Bacteroidota bacterium]